jgi:hypothetical protein
MIVMCISGLLMMTGATMALMASNASFRMRNLMLNAQALNVAEAGIGHMIGRLSTDYVTWQDRTNSGTIVNGSFSVVSKTMPGGNVIITSQGTVGKVTREVAVELLGTERDRNDMLFSLDGAILSGGDVRFATAAYTIRGNVHSNQKITSSNGANNGDFYAGIGDDSKGTITAVETIGNLDGTLIPGSPVRELPEFNFDSYRQLAIDGGVYYDGNKVFKGVSLTSPNGIIYVNGDVLVENNSSLVGTLVANGNIKLENNFDQTPYAAGMPALLATGNVIMGNRGRLNGLVYAGVNAYINNNVDILGGLISVGFTEVNNHTDVYHASEMPPWDPLQPAVPPEVIIGGWLR